jgi:hypothetical protein
MVRLLKNAEANADAKNIDVDDLYIKSIVVNQAPVRFTLTVPSNYPLTLISRKPAGVRTVPTVVSTPTKVTPSTWRSSLPPAKKKSKRRHPPPVLL